MRLYLAAMRLSFLRYRLYTAATISGLLTNIFFGLLRSYVFIALYQDRPVAEGYRLHDALTYVWVTQGLIMPLYLWGWQEIALTIRSGDIAGELSKPYDYFLFWFSRDLGRAAYHWIGRWVVTIVVGWLLFRISFPATIAAWLIFLGSFLLALTISFCLRFLINLSAFWLTDVRGMMSLILLFSNFFSGFLIPLSFFPPGWRAVAEALPFAGLVQTPFDCYLGRATGSDLALVLGKQLLWAALFVLAARSLLGVATRKLVVQGG